MSGEMATDHVNGNGTEEPMDTTAAVSRSEHFPALLEAGLPQNVAEKLDELYVAGKHTFTSLYLWMAALCLTVSVPAGWHHLGENGSSAVNQQLRSSVTGVCWNCCFVCSMWNPRLRLTFRDCCQYKSPSHSFVKVQL